MLRALAKKILASSPSSVQQELKRLHFRRLIRRDKFVPEEAEMRVISELVQPGSWVIDVGANVGHYTLHLAACAGPGGRVFAFEPLLEAFALLTANVQASGFNNVTLINAAASSAVGEAKMSVPKFQASGMDNLYRAHLSSSGDHSIFCVPLDAVPIEKPVRLIKIDAEGHDLQVLMGAEALIGKYQPILVVEAAVTGPIADWLTAHGYSISKAAPTSPNIVAQPRK